MGRMSYDQIEDVKKSILKQIGGQLTANRIPKLRFYEKIRMSPSTFKAKENDPGRFTLDELFTIAKTLNMRLYVSIGKDGDYEQPT